MVASRQVRTIGGVIAVAVGAAAAAAEGSDPMRLLFVALAFASGVAAALMVWKPERFFSEAPTEIEDSLGRQDSTETGAETRRQGSTGSEFSLVPIPTFERVAFAVLAPIVVILGIGLALGPVEVKAIMLGLSAYCFGSGRTGLRHGYNHRDRLLIMFGVLSWCGELDCTGASSIRRILSGTAL